MSNGVEEKPEGMAPFLLAPSKPARSSAVRVAGDDLVLEKEVLDAKGCIQDFDARNAELSRVVDELKAENAGLHSKLQDLEAYIKELEKEKKIAEEKTAPPAITVPIPDTDTRRNTLLPFDPSSRRRSSARTLFSDVPDVNIIELLEDVLGDFDTPATNAMLEKAFKEAALHDCAGTKVLKLAETEAYIAIFFTDNGLDVPVIRSVLRRQMFQQVMQEIGADFMTGWRGCMV